MGYLIKEATPAWAAHTTAKLLAKAGIVPTASKYGSKVVKAYKNMQARGTLLKPFPNNIDNIGNRVYNAASEKATEIFKTSPTNFNDVLGQFYTAATPPTSTRFGIAISRAPWHAPEATRVTNIRGANNEEYIRMLDPSRLQRPVAIRVTGNPVLDGVAWNRSISQALRKPELAKLYKGRILNNNLLSDLGRNHPGMTDSAFSKLQSKITSGDNASYLQTHGTVAVPDRISTRILGSHGGYNVAERPFIRKTVLDHENLGHAGMAALPVTEANKISQRYYMAMKQLDKHLAKNTTGYKPITTTESRPWLEGMDQAHAAQQSKAIRTADKRFFENADYTHVHTRIPKHEMEALGSVTKQQAFGPNTNISDELFEAARSGLLQMRRNYRRLALG